MTFRKSKETQISQRHAQILDRYLNAMASFYGRLSINDAFDIIKRQNPGIISRSEFVEFLKEKYFDEVYERDDDCYDVYTQTDMVGEPNPQLEDAEIIANVLQLDADLYERVKASENIYPLYIPPKAELLKYQKNINYVPVTPPLRAFAKWVKAHMIEDLAFKPTSDDICAEVICIQMFANYEHLFSSVLSWIAFPEAKADKIKMFDELITLLDSLLENTRTWIYRGHTLQEIKKM